ncbi:Cytochrome c heme lyase [Trametes pubescens]|uniref:Holocytochrome c-type synthase n=1 Tax=Trametes pubescens TaxID=154538 RepID=A0A1M2VQI0_TRAPU|nr:Cytochrome c heme lyase [Trametes pubescens]
MGQAPSQSMSAAPSAPASCPIDHSAAKASATSASSGPAKCPIDHIKVASSSTAPPPPAQCPISHDAPADGINPLNQMPTLSQAPAAHQEAVLPTDRETSTIPRDDGARWEYPSPQQFYNALVRKGWETPEEHVETMVQIHNFLNEQAWLEILKWEKKEQPEAEPQLARFMGRPGELSPKARFWLFAGWLLPTRFNNEPPFDRHDWIVRRGGGQEVRYVIDYYSAPPEPDGSPVFSLDVRPALDSVGSIKQRILAATEDVWANFREESRRNSSQGTH